MAVTHPHFFLPRGFGFVCDETDTGVPLEDCRTLGRKKVRAGQVMARAVGNMLCLVLLQEARHAVSLRAHSKSLAMPTSAYPPIQTHLGQAVQYY